MAPPFSSSNYVTTSSGEDLEINNTHIINGTITGTDIATGTITNANFVNGTITFEKLSSALQTKLLGFDTRLTALENAAVPAPTASITTTNANIVNGNPTTITPVFTNATTKTINGNTTVEGQNITSGQSITVNPTTTTTYTLLVTNSVGATATASVVINVSQPPPANTGWYGNLNIVNQEAGYGGRYFTFIASDATGTINVSEQYVYPGDTYSIQVLIGNRLPNMSSIITFEILQFQQDSYDYENAYINGATYTGTLYSQAYITAGTAGGNITITIPVANNI
jgi:hypothetical protein